MKLWDRNPRIEQRKLPGESTGPVVVVVDCPCGCPTPFILPAIAGVFEPNTANPPTTRAGWIQLLNDCTYPGDVHRVVVGATPCGWEGRIWRGRVRDRSDVEYPDAGNLGTRPTEVLAAIAARRIEGVARVR